MFEEIFEDIKVKFLEGLKVAGKAFVNTLWDYLREDIILSARKSLKLIEKYLNSDDGITKKKTIVELIMKKIDLPLPLKPFKFIVKKIVEDKIDSIIKELLERCNITLNNKLKVVA